MNESKAEHIEQSISPEKLAEKVSILIVKPELTDTSAPLLLLLKNKGFAAKVFRKTITEEVLHGIYPEMDTWSETIQAATKEHMLNKEVEVFIVTKDVDSNQINNVLKELLEFRGDKIIPLENAQGTLRKEFSEKTKEADDPTIPYFKNGFHCPRNVDELIRNLEALELVEEAKLLVKN